MNTITVKGFEYEIGELYMGDAGRAGYLSHHVSSVYNGGFVIQCGGVKYSTCTITKIERVGEITKAKPKLINGECYKFDHEDVGCWLLGFYSEDKDMFVVAGIYYRVSDCSDFKLMKEA